ncbi:Do family serine endopeptidase [Cocleimonas sp. KMM 6892]|uniref:Do family serine endopeptidase n=1 Tax=unclassified Cocleimonas TaxID=2639732 RepID=UPI002DBE13C6|nr:MULTISPECIES: Do family serine endopeptidase [unclassified Cocleimonas]MEB8433157.1 Do family serine endopeptidase [Cocleimonas sp. KMM 6892]MEC4715862.1 Do family serine endopeptidase [Cocleimonas sp. KMM 6895]MEC4745323.1 Do family serine endopeptidase [Cocleimonas sp. KMM 6896]
MNDKNIKDSTQVETTGTALVPSNTSNINITEKSKRIKKHKLSLMMGFIIGALSAYGLTTAPLFADTTSTNAVAPKVAVGGGLPELATMIKKSRSAVVSITVKTGKSSAGNRLSQLSEKQLERLPKQYQDLLKNLPKQPHDYGSRRGQAYGSGFIISEDGYVVTNAHVIDDADTITVKLDDKRELEAKKIGVDKLSDIALLKIEAKDLPVASFGDSDKLDVGQWVVAIGAPFGLDYTATQGIVSALSRSLPADTYVPFIQTDAAVNPGNSGGPLFDLNGQVVGVNSQIYSRSGGYMGVSFAIPINIVKNVTDQLKTSGKVSRGWLGVGIQGINEALAESLGRDDTIGSLISSVSPSSPADKAGLQAGDLILKFDNKTVEEVNDLPLLVGSTPIGKKVPVEIVRAGKIQTIDVTIDKLKSKDDEPEEVAALEKGSLGVAVTDLTDAEKEKLVTKNQGVKVAKVMPDSAAENAGLRSGDIILSVGGQSIASPSQLKQVIQKANGDKPLAVLLMRGDQALFVAVHLNS